MSLNPQKTILNGREYELVTGEVLHVDFSGTDKLKLYSIVCKLVGPFGSQASGDVIQARILDANIKNIPIIGEVVLLMKGPTAFNSAAGTAQEYYYTNPISIQSSVHQNGIPGVTDFLPNNMPSNPIARQNAEAGITNRSSDRNEVKKTIDPAFPERYDVYPLQPYSGDVIIEGRWGQSIRFGSTVDERRKYPVVPYWKAGKLSATGNPLIIISNGTNPKKKTYNEFIIENPDEDDSSIWLTSGQMVKFTESSQFMPSITNRQINLYKTNDFSGNSVLVTADRIVLNAKKQEIIGFSKEGIGFSSEKGISLDGKQVVEMESERINLGLNAVSPVLLGDKTIEWLANFCDVMSDVVQAITQQKYPTCSGPSGPPLNAGAFSGLKGKIGSLRSGLNDLPSELVFVNKKTGGSTKQEKEKAQERANSGTNVPQSRRNEGGAAPPPENLVTISSNLAKVEEEKAAILENMFKDALGSLGSFGL